jgi:hypothetical protein
MTNEIMTATPQAIEQTSSISGFFNTYDLSTDEGKIKTLQATGGAVTLNGHEGEVLPIIDALTMAGVRKGRNGMPDTTCQNTYLVTVPDESGVSTCYFTQSDGIARGINMIAAMYPDFGKSTPKGHLDLVVKAETLPNGNTLKSIVPVF